MSKKLEEKQRRRLAEERKLAERKRAIRRRNLMTVAIALVVGLAVVAAIVFQRQGIEDAENEPVGVSEAQADCGPVEEHEAQGREHIAVGTPHDPYDGPAPHSGPHYAAPDGPVQPAFYEEQLPPEGPVHNLEHGNIVIWYSPTAPAAVIADIEAVQQQEEFATVAVAYTGLQTEKNFVLAAWTTTQECDQVSQTVIDEFRRAFQGTKGPEPLTEPFEG